MVVQGKDIVNFIFAGRCHCSIQNIVSGNAFEYKIKQGNNPRYYFIKVRRLNSKEPYKNGGTLELYDSSDTLRYRYSKVKTSEVDDTAMSIQALLYVLKNYDSLSPKVRVEHFGTCGRCGRKLTDEESIHRGLGPECAKKVLF